LFLDVFGSELLLSHCPPFHLLLGSKQLAVHQGLDLGLGHRQPDPRRLRVRDGSRLLHHFVTRVCSGSNGAKSLNAHAQKRAAWNGGARAWPAGVRVWMEARAREQGGCRIAGRLRRWK
jgi:hypothetical protein